MNSKMCLQTSFATLLAVSSAAFSQSLSGVSGRVHPNGLQGTQRQSPSKQDGKGTPVIACRINALTESQRQRQSELRTRLLGNAKEIKELSDGYAFSLGSEGSRLLEAAEWISLERQCCPFFNFGLEVESEKGIWLRLTGSPQVKEFIGSQLK